MQLLAGVLASLSLVAPALACSATCFGSTCDAWVVGYSYYTCSIMENNYGCDCSSCDTCSPTMQPTGPSPVPTPSPIPPSPVPSPYPTNPSPSPTSQPTAICPETCFGRTCDYWNSYNSYYYYCERMENTYGCDCSQCPTCVPTSSPTLHPTARPGPSPAPSPKPSPVPTQAPTAPTSTPTLLPTEVCPDSCFGNTCDYWVSTFPNYYSCSTMENTYGCDCTLCPTCVPTTTPTTGAPSSSPVPTQVPTPKPSNPSPIPTPVPTQVCPSTCCDDYECMNCDEWYVASTVNTCEYLEENGVYGSSGDTCDCSACSLCEHECYSTSNDAEDPFGDGCDLYAVYTYWCGRYDDDDFSSNEMCCGCGGGNVLPPSPAPSFSFPPTMAFESVSVSNGWEHYCGSQWWLFGDDFENSTVIHTYDEDNVAYNLAVNNEVWFDAATPGYVKLYAQTDADNDHVYVGLFDVQAQHGGNHTGVYVFWSMADYNGGDYESHAELMIGELEIPYVDSDGMCGVVVDGETSCANTDDGAEDRYSDGCADWYDTYGGCGYYDDYDFSANEMCCTCGGGENHHITYANALAYHPYADWETNTWVKLEVYWDERNITATASNGYGTTYTTTAPNSPDYGMGPLLLGTGYLEGDTWFKDIGVAGNLDSIPTSPPTSSSAPSPVPNPSPTLFCPATCYAPVGNIWLTMDCQGWFASYGYTCSYLEEYFSCECTGCGHCQPSPEPTPRYMPTAAPSITHLPSSNPTPKPTPLPIPVPTPRPSPRPTPRPTSTPFPQPSATPTRAPTSKPTTPSPSTLPNPMPTVVKGAPTATPIPAPTPMPSMPPTPRPIPVPTATPTPAPTRTPIVSTSVTLEGITCEPDFDETVFQDAMDATIGEDDATFSDSTCTDNDRRLQGDGRRLTTSVTISTEVTIALLIVNANGATSALQHLVNKLDAATLETNIQNQYSRRRRLDLSSVSVSDIGVDTFTPTPAPTETPTTAVPTGMPTPAPTMNPTSAPSLKPTFPAPSAVPIPSPTKVVEVASSSSSASSAGGDEMMIIIIGVLVALVFVGGGVLLLVLRMKNSSAPGQTPEAPAAASVTAIALSTPVNVGDVQMVEQPATAAKHSIAI